MPDIDLIAELERMEDVSGRVGGVALLHGTAQRILAALRQAATDCEHRDELARALLEAGRLKIVVAGDTPDQDKRELCWCHCNSDRCLGEPRCQAATEALANVV